MSTYGEAERLYRDATRDEQMEEAIAQFFAEFRQGGKMLPRYRRVFAKVRDFLTRLGNALRGMGFHSVESIFAKVESGEVGRRPEGYLSSESQYETDYLTGGRGGARYARGPVNMERAEVPVHPGLFAKLGVRRRPVRANYVNLADTKHPEHFASPEEAREHVEWVLADPTYALPSMSDPGHVVLVRRNGKDKLVAVRFDLRRRNRSYWVRSAYPLKEGQLEGMFEAIRRQGGTPELLSVTRLPEALVQATPQSPHDDRPSDRLIRIARGEIAGNSPSGSDAKYSRYNLRRMAAAMANPPQAAGTDEQRAALAAIFGNDDKPPLRERVRDAINHLRRRQVRPRRLGTQGTERASQSVWRDHAPDEPQTGVGLGRRTRRNRVTG